MICWLLDVSGSRWGCYKRRRMSLIDGAWRFTRIAKRFVTWQETTRHQGWGGFLPSFFSSVMSQFLLARTLWGGRTAHFSLHRRDYIVMLEQVLRLRASTLGHLFFFCNQKKNAKQWWSIQDHQKTVYFLVALKDGGTIVCKSPSYILLSILLSCDLRKVNGVHIWSWRFKSFCFLDYFTHL